MDEVGRREREVEVHGDLRPQPTEVLRIAEPALSGDDLEVVLLAVGEADPLPGQTPELLGRVAECLLHQLARDRGLLVPAGEP